MALSLRLRAGCGESTPVRLMASPMGLAFFMELAVLI
jgi:hypothetical protein